MEPTRKKNSEDSAECTMHFETKIKVFTKPSDLPEIYQKNAIEIIESRFGFKDYKITVEPGSKVGDNYSGVIHRIIATDNVTGQSRNMILKVPPQSAARRQEFNCRMSFLREIETYNKIFVEFQKFEDLKGITPQESGFYQYAECYRTMSDDQEEGLFFEDLKQTDFEMLSRFIEPTLDYAGLLMQTLGKFHAISFAMKDQDSQIFVEYREMPDFMTTMYRHPNMNLYLRDLYNRVLSTLNPEEDDITIKKCEKIFDADPADLLHKLVNGKAMEQYSVICHGDCWNNNMLFKCNETGKPVDIRLIDFQIVRYGSPALDLSYYIFCSTHKTLRENHYEEMLQIYHKSLTQHLTRLGSDAEKIFPYSALKSELKRVGKFGLTSAVLVLPIVVENVANTIDYDEIAERINNGEIVEQPIMKEETQQKFNKRMRDVLVDMERYGYLD